ncbi:hypothetical protein MMC17_006186 [Xylographa soralifera]|nr:hypothetical protein [Xylographa soralifera]
MPRVRQHRAASRASSTARRILTNRDKPTYRVVLEEVTQKKKKLITAGSSKTNPPAGYTFIPAGDPQITNRCKEIARKDGATVYAVSTTKHKHSDLSKEVHRIGYHFPSSVVGRACLSLGVSLSRDGHVLRHQHDWIADEARSRNQNGTRLNLLAHNTSNTKLSQATIDTQAREAIKDLFPKIPDKDLRDIITHAFELGKARVGTAPELPLPRRVQLAVVAHIRHTYTDYDNLLKEVPWNAARAMIEQASLNKLAQWRGDDDDEPDAMEDILREIIVIPDDDEEDANEAGDSIAQRRYANTHESLEIIASRDIVDDMETRPIDYSNLRIETHDAESPKSDDDQVIFLGHGQYVIDRPDQARSKRNRDHRHRAWEEARERFRYPAAQPRSPSIRLLPQAVGIASKVHVRRGSYEHIEKLPPQQNRANNQKITNVREAQPVRNLSVDQAIYQSMADYDHREVVYPEQTRSFAPVSNVFGTVGRHATARDISREYQNVQYVPSQPSPAVNRVYMEHERENHVNTLRINPPSHEQVPVPNRSNQRPPRSPTSRAESVLQSIEQSSHFMSQNQQSIRPPYAHSPVQIRYFNASEMQRGPVFHRVDPNMNDEQQLVKRRRINQGHDRMHDPNPLHNDLQRSLLVPVGHTDRYEFSDRTPDIPHRINGLEPSVRTERTQDAREVYRIGELDQRDASVYQSIYPEHVSPSGTQVLRHGQLLMTQQQSSSHVSARSFVQPTVQKIVPEYDEHRSVQNVSYLPRSSYVSLPRQDLRISHAVAYDVNRRTAQGSSPWDENVRVSRPVFGQTSEVKGYLPPDSNILQMKPRTSAEQSGNYLVREPPVQVQTRISRKALSLERSFEHLRPIQNPILNGEIDRLEGSLHDDTFDQVVTVRSTPKSQVPWPQIQMQHDLALDHVQYGEKQRSFDGSVHEGDRSHKMYQSDIEPRQSIYLKEIAQEMRSEFRRPAVQIPSLRNRQQRALDKHNGREMIVLE